MSRPILSAAMIVRDEAHHIEDCLRSLSSVVDEIVVVDTGSADDTPELARAHGATVAQEPWRDDFAAARNAALARCSGDWILYIDADERVRRGSTEGMRDLLEDGHLGACFVGLKAKTGYLPYREMRLFRSDPMIRFEGVIHENIWPALSRYLLVSARAVAQSPLLLDHVGYEGDQTHKHRRNLPLLLRALEQDPGQVYCWTHLAIIRRALGDGEGAREALTSGLAAARRRRPGPEQDSLAFLEFADLERAEGRDPRPIVEELLELFPGNAQGLALRGRLNLDDGRVAAAEADFRALAAWPSTQAATTALGYRPALFDAVAFEGIAACHWREGRYGTAAEWLVRAQAAAPDHAELRYKLALCRKLAATTAPEPE